MIDDLEGNIVKEDIDHKAEIAKVRKDKESKNKNEIQKFIDKYADEFNLNVDGTSIANTEVPYDDDIDEKKLLEFKSLFAGSQLLQDLLFVGIYKCYKLRLGENAENAGLMYDRVLRILSVWDYLTYVNNMDLKMTRAIDQSFVIDWAVWEANSTGEGLSVPEHLIRRLSELKTATTTKTIQTPMPLEQK